MDQIESRGFTDHGALVMYVIYLGMSNRVHAIAYSTDAAHRIAESESLHFKGDNVTVEPWIKGAYGGGYYHTTKMNDFVYVEGELFPLLRLLDFPNGE